MQIRFIYMSAPSGREGFANFTVDGETHQTWYQVFGSLSNIRRPPLVVIHGGPGLSHDYLYPLSDLATTSASIAVIFYDQLGNGRSSRLPNKPKEFWTMDLFVDELENLIAHLGVGKAFDLLGHSFGGMIGAQYVAERQPSGLRHLILSDSFASMDLWNQSIAQLAQAFPPDVQEGLRLGMHDLPKYQYALMKFYSVHGCTVQPFPKQFIQTFGHVFGDERDTTVADAM